MTQPNESTTNPAAAPDRAGDVRRRPSLRLLLALLVCPAVALAVGLGGYTFIVDGRDGVIALVAGPEAVEAWPQEHRQDPLSQFNTSNLAVDSSRIQVGTPKRDAIPAITGPHTVPVRQAGFLRGDDRVVGVVVDGRARAYPIRILNRHEVVNDTLGSMPIAVLFCPLCDSVTVVERRIEERPIEFGVSGLLLNSNVLLYDRIDESLWSQLGMQAISGDHVGKSLNHISSWFIGTMRQFAAQYPEGDVLSFRIQPRRGYDSNPYARYLASDELMFGVAHEDDRMPRKTRVIGVRRGNVVKAYPLKAIAARPDRRLVDDVGGARLVLLADEDGEHVAIIEAPLDAKIAHTFWFAWVAFNPKTQVVGELPGADDGEEDGDTGEGAGDGTGATTRPGGHGHGHGR